MASPMQRLADALAFLSPQRKAAVLRAANENPALYAKLMQATEADDFNKTLRMVVANDAGQWGAAPARPAPVRPEAPAALTTAQRMMRDPNIRPAIDANLDRLPPELAERIAADDPDAFMEAFQMIAEAEGELPLRGPDPFENIAPDDGVGMPPELSAMTDDQQAAFVADMMNAPPPATRQMELPLTADVPTSFSAQAIGPIPTGPDFVATAGPLPGGMDALLQRLNAANGSRHTVPPSRPSVVQRGRIGRLGDLTPAQIGLAGAAGVGAFDAGFLAGNRIGDELISQNAVPESRAFGGDAVELTGGDTAGLAAETNPPPEVAATQPDEFSHLREMQSFVQEQNADMEKLKELKYSQSRTPDETQYLRMMKVPIPGDWKRAVEAGHVPLGDATPAEIEAANARIRNMVRMGATWDEAKTRAYDDMAKGVVARAKQKAEAFLQANPGF